jgi:D-sedoheptulose 7-phosphate isomerase
MFDLQSYLGIYSLLVRRLDRAAVENVIDLVWTAWDQRQTVFLFGNGGSASNAAHIAADLTKLTAPPRGPRLRAIALGNDVPGLTAAANDMSYDDVFVEGLKSFMEAGDVVIGLSTSGRSSNVLKAVEYAREAGGITVGICGAGGRPLADLVDHAVIIPSTSVQHIEDATMVIGHLVCLGVRDLIVPSQEHARVPAGRPWAGSGPAS